MIVRRLTGLAVAAGLMATTLATPASAAGTTTDLGASLSYGSSSGDLAVGGGKVFVSAEDRIIVTNAQGDLTGSITGLSSVYGLAAKADGSSLYAAVAGSNQVAEIDTGTLEIKRRIDLPEHPCPTSLALTGERLWVGYGCFDKFQGGFLALDLTATSPTPVAIGLGLHSAPKVVAAGNTLVVGEVTGVPADLIVYDISGPAPTLRGKIDGVTHDQSEVRDLALTSDGAHVISAFDTPYRFDTWNTTTLARVRRYGQPHEAYPTGLAISSDDAYVAGGRDWNTDVTVYDAATGATVFSEDNPAGRFVTGGLAFSGTNLYALLRGSGDQLHLWRIEDITAPHRR
ncbi:WD40 repeat domain-containing protein [Nonomuraea angiospora]|uniref:WD40 repeat domain-containing protein n=1 Tax=Nonomuraea angiospora TaxID=46172 RepID=UPI0034505936